MPESDFHHGGIKTGFSSGPVQLILALGNPLFFENNKYGVVFEERKEPKLYESILSIYEGNKRKITSALLVNSPVSYKGYKFYQSNYNPENLNYSGILVVKDPGLTFVYIGFILICVGIVYIFYIKPKILEKQKSRNLPVQEVLSTLTP
jgi:cytochrome c biogenesis protein ResB